jgi:hypothetical protein
MLVEFLLKRGHTLDPSMKIVRKTTWRDDGEEILGEERATVLARRILISSPAASSPLPLLVFVLSRLTAINVSGSALKIISPILFCRRSDRLPTPLFVIVIFVLQIRSVCWCGWFSGVVVAGQGTFYFENISKTIRSL